MSAASDLTSGPGAQQPGAGGAGLADAMTEKRAKLAQLDRDRDAFDDVSVRSRNGGAVEEGLAGREHGLVVNAESQTLSRKRCLDIVKEARGLLRKATRPTARTAVNYMAKSTRLCAVFDQLVGDEPSRWSEVLQPYAAKKNSFYAMRAAATWRIREQIRTLTAEQCRMQRRGPTKDWHSILVEVESLIARVLAIEGVKRNELLETSGTESIRAASKRNDLRHFSPDWREQMIEASAMGAHGDAVWVLANTGCRPEELLTGVELRPEFAHITVRIHGAKTGESAGQPWRELDVSWRSVPFGLIERMAGRETFVVGVCSTGALRNAVADVGKRLWPRGRRMCPYHFRHQMAEDLRESGWTADEIGAVLGHCVGETSSNYGRRKRKGQRSVAREPVIVRAGVRTATPVRPVAAFDPSTIRKKQRATAGPNGS
jgi:integrase